MSTWYYTNEKGERVCVTGGQLKGLAKTGLITPDTIVETENGKTARAGKVKGLTFLTATPLVPTPPVESEIYGLASPPTSPFTASVPEETQPSADPQVDKEAFAALAALVANPVVENPFTVPASEAPNPFTQIPSMENMTAVDNPFAAPMPKSANPFTAAIPSKTMLVGDDPTRATSQEIFNLVSEKVKGLPKPVIVTGIAVFLLLLLVGGVMNSGGNRVSLTAEDQEMIDRWIEYGGDARSKGAWDMTLLHHAANNGSVAVAQHCVSRGADVNAVARQSNQWTPLHHAADNGYIGVVKFLVSKGANVNAKDFRGNTPLDLAKDGGHSAVVKYLSSRR
jgi:hypothetical protein